MNCEEYRQAIGADPSFDGGAAHLRECAACQAYRREMLEFDEKIRAALSIEVPALDVPDLPLVDADDGTGGNVVSIDQRRWKPRMVVALAATVMLAAFVGLRMVGTGEEFDSLADELLAHIDHEPYSQRVTDVPVSEAQLATVVPANVAKLDNGVGLVTYARSCVIHGHDVPHLVIQGEHGPVTLLLMPHEKVDGPQSVQGESVNGVILPVGGGSIAIFGERDENLERIEKNVLDSVTWRT